MTDEELAAKFKSLEDKIEEVENWAADLEDDIDSLQESLANAHSDIKSLQSSIDRLTDE